MIKYRPWEFYAVAVYLHPLLELEDNTENTLLIKRLVEARCSLSVFTSPLIDKYLPSSAEKAAGIMKVIDDRLSRQGTPAPTDLLGSRINAIRRGVKDFETLLDDEITKAPIFCLERIGNLSTDSLLEGAHKGYAEDVKAALTQACKDEIDDAGKCLAFERATATGFHILRSVEIAIRQYLARIPGFTMPPLNRQNWGEYIKLLKDNGAAKVVTDALQNIKDNYRNPLMHPEDRLELSEAINLFSLCQGMTESLMRDFLQRGLTP